MLVGLIQNNLPWPVPLVVLCAKDLFRQSTFLFVLLCITLFNLESSDSCVCKIGKSCTLLSGEWWGSGSLSVEWSYSGVFILSFLSQNILLLKPIVDSYINTQISDYVYCLWPKQATNSQLPGSVPRLSDIDSGPWLTADSQLSCFVYEEVI